MIDLEQKTYYQINYDLANRLIRAHIYPDYEIIAELESGNDVYYTFQVEPYDMQPDERCVGEVLNHLCYLGHIPRGNYLLEVSW